MVSLEPRGICHNYGHFRVVGDINFTLRAGEICGYLGANGSGKTTTVRLIAGLMSPTLGQVLCDGEPIGRDLRGFHARLGYVPEEPQLYNHLSANEYLELAGGLRRIPQSTLRRRIDAAIEAFGIGASRDAAIQSFSKGMKQKVLLAAAMLHDPEILILDEPLSGLDVNAVQLVRHVFLEYAKRGRIVLYSSHILDVVERICSRVIVLHRGRVVADDSVAKLRVLSQTASLEAAFAQITAQPDYERGARELVGAMGD